MTGRKYTESQKKAIKWDEGPVIVLAGPGSGKTTVLTERLIRILEESPEESFRVLALTFTNKAASEMAERVSEEVCDKASRVFIGTFHSFCADVLRNHGAYVGIKPDYEIYSSTDDLNDIVSDLKREYLLIHPESEVEDIKILNAIQYFEKNLCFTDEDLDVAMPNTIYKADLKWFYKEYLNTLEKNNVMDFDSLVLYAYKLFSTRPSIARIYRSTYRYISIDEFQDTNKSQYMLIKSLAGDTNRNLFVVADDDQVIYGWNGASYKRISEFKKEYHAELIQLNQNFRCPPEVINAANNLIMHNSGRTDGKKPLVAMKDWLGEDTGIRYGHFNNVDEEIDGITQLIEKLQKEYPEESICVLARNNFLLDKAYNTAKGHGIECEKSKRKDEFENRYVLWMYLILKLANRRTDEKILEQIVSIMDSRKQLNCETMVLEAQLSNGDLLKTLISNIKEIIDDDAFYKSLQLNLCEGKDFIQFVKDAFEWSEKRIEKIFKGDNKQVLDEFKLEKKAWIDFEKNLSNNYSLDEITLSTYMQEFAMTSKEAEPKKDAVQFLTIHASKGKEFDNVIIMGVVEGELPSYQSVKKGDDSPEMEEERRNCFVAITRTKKRLFLAYSNNYSGWVKYPSRFIKEMLGDQFVDED